MVGQGKTVEEIADLITEAIFSESIVDKKQVRTQIYVLIKSFVKVQNSPYKAFVSSTPVKEGERASLVKNITQKDFEVKFWRHELRSLVGEIKMKSLYEKCDMELLKEKFKTA